MSERREPLAERDCLHRFVLETAGVRGALVRLNASWAAVREGHAYPPAVRDLLGEALAAVTLLAAIIEIDGPLILQAQGDGPLRILVTQATGSRTVRGLARWRAPVERGDLQSTFGRGHLALTVHGRDGEPRQGIVPLEGRRLAEALETYFAQSEQLDTRLWLATGGDTAAGLLVQVRPGHDREPDDWMRVSLLADTVSEAELCGLPAVNLLSRLFHEEDVRLFESEPVAFRCDCSRSRIERTLAVLGHESLDDLVDAHGAVVVTCEFCNRRYRFDRVDVERALIDGAFLDAPDAVQ